MSRDERIESHLPLKAAVLHVLLALVGEARHGYGIMAAVRLDSGDRVRLTTGAFYRHLNRLVEGGLVRETEERPEDDDPRRGAYYRLTDFGRDVLAAESRRLALLVAATSEAGLLPVKGRP